MFHHRLALGYALVVHHLGCQRYTGNGGLQLVGHIIDKVVLYLRQPLRAEDSYYREDKGDEQHYREDDTRYHKADRRVDIAVHIGKVNLHDTHLRGWVIAEQHLRVSVLFAFFRVVGATVHLATILGRHGEVITDINAVIHQLGLEILIQ